MEDKSLENALTWLHDLQKGAVGYDMEIRLLEGLRVTQARKGFDADGNWNAGAIATMMDMIGAVAIYSVSHHLITSVDFTISYYSTAKIQEDVEMEVNVMAKKGRLTQVIVEVKRKENGELIALGKQWMASNKLTAFQVSRL